MLDHIGEPSQPPVLAPARGPPEMEFDLESDNSDGGSEPADDDSFVQAAEDDSFKSNADGDKQVFTRIIRSSFSSTFWSAPENTTDLNNERPRADSLISPKSL